MIAQTGPRHVLGYIKTAMLWIETGQTERSRV